MKSVEKSKMIVYNDASTRPRRRKRTAGRPSTIFASAAQCGQAALPPPSETQSDFVTQGRLCWGLAPLYPTTSLRRRCTTMDFLGPMNCCAARRSVDRLRLPRHRTC